MELKRIPYDLSKTLIGGSNRIELLKRKACGKAAGPF